MHDRNATHRSLDAIGIRAHATAVGLVQLTIELRRLGVLDDLALANIKEAIGLELELSRPRNIVKSTFAADVRARLDRIFAGEQPISPLGSDNQPEP